MTPTGSRHLPLAGGGQEGLGPVRLCPPPERGRWRSAASRWGSAAVLIITLLAPSFSHAEDALTDPDAAAAAAKELASKSAAMKMDIDALQDRLVTASRKERDTNDDLRALVKRIHELEQEQTQVGGELKARRQTLADLLVALARLSRLPPDIGLLRQDKTKDALLSAALLNSSLPEIRADAQRLATTLHDLDRVQTDLEKQRTALANARRNQERERMAIEDLINARKEKLQLTTQQQADINARLEKLRREAQNMDDLITRVTALRPADKPVKDKDTTPLALRGGYLQPVSGDLKSRFGSRDDAGIESKGLTFSVEGNSRIVAPARGRVMFAGPFRGYGQIVIIEHDNNMHSLVGGFGRIDVSVGQRVAQGEPLGLVEGAPASYRDVYFELRKNGDPIDPKPRVR